MAAATVNSMKEVVSGSTRVQLYNADIADTNTIATGMHEILAASSNVPGKITAIAVSGGTATFSVTSGPANGALVRVEGF